MQGGRVAPRWRWGSKTPSHRGAGLALLRFLAAQGEGAAVSRETLARHFPDEPDHTLDLLIRRELIEPADGGYRFQVELIRRWFARRVE